MAEKAPLPPFTFPPPGSTFVLITVKKDGAFTVQSSDRSIADPKAMVVALRTIADRIAADESGAVMLG